MCFIAHAATLHFEGKTCILQNRTALSKSGWHPVSLLQFVLTMPSVAQFSVSERLVTALIATTPALPVLGGYGGFRIQTSSKYVPFKLIGESEVDHLYCDTININNRQTFQKCGINLVFSRVLPKSNKIVFTLYFVETFKCAFVYRV